MRTIDASLQVSSIFMILLIVSILSTFLLICTLPLSLWIKFLLIGTVLSYGLNIIWQNILHKGKNAINRIYLDNKGWHCTTGDQTLAVELSGHSTITTLVSVICFKDVKTRKKLAVVVFKDSLPLPLYRKLIVEMRTYKAFKPSKTSLSL